jgi:hypothetical protein
LRPEDGSERGNEEPSKDERGHEITEVLSNSSLAPLGRMFKEGEGTARGIGVAIRHITPEMFE